MSREYGDWHHLLQFYMIEVITCGNTWVIFCLSYPYVAWRISTYIQDTNWDSKLTRNTDSTESRCGRKETMALFKSKFLISIERMFILLFELFVLSYEISDIPKLKLHGGGNRNIFLRWR